MNIRINLNHKRMWGSLIILCGLILFPTGVLTAWLDMKYNWNYWGFGLTHGWKIFSVLSIILWILYSIFKHETEVDKMVKKETKKNPVNYDEIGIIDENKESSILNVEDDISPKHELSSEIDFMKKTTTSQVKSKSEEDLMIEKELENIKNSVTIEKKKEDIINWTYEQLAQKYIDLRREELKVKELMMKRLSEQGTE